MVEYHEIPGTNIVELTVDGKISAPEFDDLLSRMRGAIERHGKVRVLEHIRSFRGMPVSKWWDDVKFGFQHSKDVERAAVVADKAWIEMGTNFAKHFVRGEIRYYDASELNAARAWITEA
jgi:hypothetical protein